MVTIMTATHLKNMSCHLHRTRNTYPIAVALAGLLLLPALLLPVSAAAPVYEEVTMSQKDLTQYHLPASSRYPSSTVKPDTWVFTDGLGRVALTNQEVGAPREDRTVAMFYWDWHANFAKTRKAFNTQGFIDEQTAAGIPLEEYIHDRSYEGWGLSGENLYFWNEPIYGFYSSDDAWVLRRHAELLSAAGVDVIFHDTTNGISTWKDGYTAVYASWADAQIDGVDTPKITNLMPFSPGENTAVQLRELYNEIYRDGNYRPLWFYWDGKPMIAAHSFGSLSLSETDQEIAEFFTFRGGQPSYFVDRTTYKTWGWLSAIPQAKYYASRDDVRAKRIEQMTVGVAQNANYIHRGLSAMNGGSDVMGRSYTSDDPERYVREGDEASKWGYNFAEQWKNALEADPRVVFVTGWNEWNVFRTGMWPDGGNCAVDNAFPDQFNDEYSRDIEPTRGALADHYYYQLVNFVRQYKGVDPIPVPSKEATIDMSAGYEQWQRVEPYYAAHIGNTDNRDNYGYKGHHYTEYSGRNDIIGAQVARDGDHLWFLVECAADITAYTDPLWMNLYIDADQTNDGWNSFDFVVNKTAPTDQTAVLEKFTDGYTSEKVADVAYTVDGRYMTVKIPKSLLGLEGADYTVNFAWTDNVHDVADVGEQVGEDYVYSTFSGDILDFYTSGDVAPGGRFKFSYVSTTENSGIVIETEPPITDAPTDPETDVPTSAAVTEPVSETTVPTETEKADKNRGCASAVCAATLTVLTAGVAWPLIKKRED